MSLSNAEAAIVVSVIANGLPPFGAEPRSVELLLAGGALERARPGMPHYLNATPAGRSMLARHVPERESYLVAMWPGPRFIATRRIDARSLDEYCVGIASSLPALDLKLKDDL